jgi:hypothetical protein
MKPDEVIVRVNAKVKEGVGWYDSRLSRERQRVINYYNSVLPKRSHLGSSPYISTDVYDSVEAMKSQLVETFSANPDNLISFPALGPQDRGLHERVNNLGGQTGLHAEVANVVVDFLVPAFDAALLDWSRPSG